MNISEIKKKIECAINMFYARDSLLLNLSASEWAIAHRIALYLETLVIGWNVDCEYNKAGFDMRTKNNSEGDYKRPDIIVHHRGYLEKAHNLLVIEIKVENSDEDYKKLKDFTSPPNENRPFQYKYGLALSFENNLKTTWFFEGQNYDIENNLPFA